MNQQVFHSALWASLIDELWNKLPCLFRPGYSAHAEWFFTQFWAIRFVPISALCRERFPEPISNRLFGETSRLERRYHFFSTLQLWCGMCILDFDTRFFFFAKFSFFESLRVDFWFAVMNMHSVTGSVGKPRGYRACVAWTVELPSVPSCTFTNGEPSVPILHRPNAKRKISMYSACYVLIYQSAWNSPLPHSNCNIEKTIGFRCARVISLKLLLQVAASSRYLLVIPLGILFREEGLQVTKRVKRSFTWPYSSCHSFPPCLIFSSACSLNDSFVQFWATYQYSFRTTDKTWSKNSSSGTKKRFAAISCGRP